MFEETLRSCLPHLIHRGRDLFLLTAMKMKKRKWMKQFLMYYRVHMLPPLDLRNHYANQNMPSFEPIHYQLFRRSTYNKHLPNLKKRTGAMRRAPQVISFSNQWTYRMDLCIVGGCILLVRDHKRLLYAHLQTCTVRRSVGKCHCS